MKNDRFILNRNSGVKVIYIGTGQFQLASGKWVDAILYKYRGVYKMMEASEFIRLAEPDRSSTLYSDWESVSSDGASLVEKGEIDATPTMQNALKPKDRGVLDIITDTIGPGYEPGRVGQVEQATLIKEHKYDK